MNKVVAHQCGMLLGPEKERSIDTCHKATGRDPCCPHGTSLMILPWEVPPHTVSSREEVPVSSPHRRVQQASYRVAGGRDAGPWLQGPKVRWESCGGWGCAEACALGQMEYSPKPKVAQATLALQEATRGRGEGPEAGGSWPRPGRPCWRPHFTGAGSAGHWRAGSHKGPVMD